MSDLAEPESDEEAQKKTESLIKSIRSENTKKQMRKPKKKQND